MLPWIGVWIAYAFVAIGGIVLIFAIYLSIAWGRQGDVPHTRFENESNPQTEAGPSSGEDK